MAQGSRQVQTQAQQQIQTLSPQQILVVKLLELPAVELEDRVRAELLENPALEEGKEDTPGDEYPDTPDAETGSEDGGDTSCRRTTAAKGSRQKKFLSPTPPPSMKPCASSSASRT